MKAIDANNTQELSLHLLAIKKITPNEDKGSFVELFLGENSILNTNYYSIRQFHKGHSVLFHKYIVKGKNNNE